MQHDPQAPPHAPVLVGLRRWLSTRRTLLRRLRYAEDALMGHVRVVAKLRADLAAVRPTCGECSTVLVADDETTSGLCMRHLWGSR